MRVDREEEHFEATDGATLVGTIHLPEAEGPVPALVAVHGSSVGIRSFFLYEHLAGLLAPQGIATFIYDRRGEGASGGKPDASLTTLAADARAAVKSVGRNRRIDPGRIGLWGISQGGWIAPMAAANNEDVAFLVVLSASGVSPGDQMTFATANLLREAGCSEQDVERASDVRVRMNDLYLAGDREAAARVLEEAQREPWFEIAYLPSPDEMRAEEDEPFEVDLDIRPVLERLTVPILLIYGETDRWVPVEASIEVWRSAVPGRAPLTVRRISGTGHMLTFPDARDDPLEVGPVSVEYERVLMDWLTVVPDCSSEGR